MLKKWNGVGALFLLVLLVSSCTNEEEFLKMKRELANLQEQIYAIEAKQSEMRTDLKSALQDLTQKVDDRSAIAEVKDNMFGVNDQLALFEARFQDLENRIAEVSRANTMVQPLGGGEPNPPATPLGGGEAPPAEETALSGNDVENQFNQVLLDFNRGKFDAAIFGFEELINQFPNSPQSEASRYYLGRAYFETKNWQKAVDHFDSVRRKYPNGNFVRQSFYYLGRSYYAMNAHSKAVLILRELTEKYPGTQEHELAKSFLRKAGFEN